MSRKTFTAITWLLVGLVIGAIVSRLWQGGLVDTLLVAAIVLFVVSLAARSDNARQKIIEPSSIPVPAVTVAQHATAMPLAESFDASKHVLLVQRGNKIILRLQNIARLQFVEFALSVPSWFSLPTRSPSPSTPSTPAPSLMTVVRRFIRAHPRRASLLVLTFWLMIFVLLLLLEMSRTADYTIVVILWLVAMAGYAVAVVPIMSLRAKRSRVRVPFGLGDCFVANCAPRNDISRLPIVLIMLGIVLLALALRLWQVDSIPFSLGGDEASQGLESLRVIRGETTSPFVTGWYSVPTMSFFFNSITLRIFGATILGLRLPWVFVGTATVLITFGLVARLAGMRIGLLSAGLLAVYHYSIHFSRLGSNQIADPFFVALALFFLYRARARRQPFDWMMLGAASAGSLYFYAGARLTILIVLAAIGYEFLRDRRNFWRTHRRGLLIALGSFLIVGGPMLLYALRFPEDYNSRINQVGIFQNGWIELAKQATGQSVPELVFDQFRRAALAFNFYPDRTVWYGLRTPLLDPIFGVLFLLGLCYATVRVLLPRGDRRLFPMVAWWWGAIILGGMLTESPPSSMRLVTLTVPVCFFIALALWKIFRLAKKAMAGVPVNTLLLASFMLFSGISLKTYFVDYTPQRIYGSVRAEMATTIAPILRDLAPNHHFYFVGAPYMYWGFATLPFLVPDADVTDLADPITSPTSLKLVSVDQGMVFIFVPERAPELRFVQQAFPQGRLGEIHSAVNDELLALLYIVER